MNRISLNERFHSNWRKLPQYRAWLLPRIRNELVEKGELSRALAVEQGSLIEARFSSSPGLEKLIAKAAL